MTFTLSPLKLAIFPVHHAVTNCRWFPQQKHQLSLPSGDPSSNLSLHRHPPSPSRLSSPGYDLVRELPLGYTRPKTIRAHVLFVIGQNGLESEIGAKPNGFRFLFIDCPGLKGIGGGTKKRRMEDERVTPMQRCIVYVACIPGWGASARKEAGACHILYSLCPLQP
ncbi:hypothetical protein E1B28_002756 [Marasmius oreades]|uniref:Uncharacterized protein n=1 Tax=Marasmius oreades TaxID=181124 RepID=A0A9P7RNN1_9AGAR|nr:uncharacterized protein E1B28_002756 [Marasmius oreades]KAG7086835.1 hypothetical protein E1B28_002756 [Marasmius oreades]